MPGVISLARHLRASRVVRSSVCRAVATVAVAATLTCSALAGTPRVLLDINPHSTPVSSNPVPLGRLGSVYLFGAQTGSATATALFQTDFTAAGTASLKTFAGEGPVAASLGPNFLKAGSRTYFIASETATGRDVWVTDGSSAGTHIVSDLGAPSAGAPPQLIGLFGSDLIFLQPDATLVTQLYRTDGTSAGTRALTSLTGSVSRATPPSSMARSISGAIAVCG